MVGLQRRVRLVAPHLALPRPASPQQRAVLRSHMQPSIGPLIHPKCQSTHTRSSAHQRS